MVGNANRLIEEVEVFRIHFAGKEMAKRVLGLLSDNWPIGQLVDDWLPVMRTTASWPNRRHF